LLALRAGRDVKADTLTFGQGLETLALNRGKVGEEVFTALVRGNEAETLGIVEPLDGTSCHILKLRKNFDGAEPRGWGEYQDGEVNLGELLRAGRGY
jgi:hypothetical protein